ncbi:MAG: NADH-quinone oxidoreductase subunit L [Anaerolineaceae bacterium]|nr:NADH-quinone oxidoreductase subunit L [Anaerolineaceae bacterium]
MLIAVLSGFVLALLAPTLHRAWRGPTGWLLALGPAALFVYFASHLPAVAHGDVIREVAEWVPSLGVNLTFLMDGLSLMMALIISGVGTLIIIYAGGYLRGDPYLGRMYAFLLAFMAAMLGVVLADNLLALFIFWELTSITSYLLIGYKHNYADSRAAALRALIVTGSGGLAMLAGFIMLALVGGTWEISSLSEQGELVRASALYLPILILIGIGAFTKSAQFPFHFWLPGAMAAPTPVSAYLHSATMVKAGVYLLARLSPTLAGSDEWRLIVTTVGVVTMLVGGYLSLKQFDLKRILAYSTVSSLGVLVALLGWDTKIAAEATALFLLVHSLYKGTLFMVAGAIDHETGTRDIRQLGGLGRVMPLLAVASGLAALSMSGVPGFLGFVGKEFIYEATLGYVKDEALMLTAIEALMTLLALLTNIAFVAVALLVTLVPFTGKDTETPQHPHAPPLNLWFSPFVLGAMGLVLGLLPHFVAEMLTGPAAGAIYGQELEMHLFILPEYISPMFILSVLTIIGGILVYTFRARLQGLYETVNPSFGAERAYEAAMAALPRLANNVTDVLQNGYLRYYVATITGVLVLLVGYTYYVHSQLAFPAESLLGFDDVQFHEAAIAIIMMIGLFSVLRSSTLLITVVSLGVIGYGSAILFVLFGAPDLAMTQFAIETLSVVLFVLVLYRLPPLARLSTRRARFRDMVLALLAGGMVTTFILVVTSQPMASDLANYFVENSYTAAHGKNVVNVILVDFRGFDTMGEITVLGIAAMGIFGLLKLRSDVRQRRSETDPSESSAEKRGDDA